MEKIHIKFSQILNINEINNKILKYLECKLCSDVCVFPQKEVNCENLFCLKCIEALHKENNNDNCPFKCSNSKFKSISNLEKIYYFQNIIIACENRKFGCLFSINYKNLETFISHLQSCEYKSKKCDQCGIYILENRINTHSCRDSTHKKEESNDLYMMISDLKNNNIELNLKLQEFEKIIKNQKEQIESLKSINVKSSEFNDLKLEINYLKYENNQIKKSLDELNGKSIWDRNYEERNEKNLSEIKGEIESVRVKGKNKIRDIKLENSSIKKNIDLISLLAEKTLEELKMQLIDNFNAFIKKKDTEIFKKFSDNEKSSSNNLFENNTSQINKEVFDTGHDDIFNSNTKQKSQKEEYKWEIYGLKYIHPNNFDHTITCHKELPQYFKACVKIKPSDNAWFAFGVVTKKLLTNNNKFMWCTEGITDCYAYNANGMISDKNEAKKYGQTYWQKENIISIIMDKDNNI